MEEWRAVLVDSTAMSLINGHEIGIEDFYKDEESGAVLLGKKGFRLFLNKLDQKFRTSAKYLKYTDDRVSFRRAIDLQILQLVQSMEDRDPDIYSPVIIR